MTNFFDEAYDDRVSNYPLMGNAQKPLILIAGYLFFVKYVGVKYMLKREPYKLQWITTVYNALQVILCSVLTIKILCAIIEHKNEYDFVNCPMPDFNRTARSYTLLNLEYFYYMLKVLDLMDTVFIILKKNNRQASILHIYHHGVMVLAAYFHAQYYPGGAYIIPFMLNSFVHVIMYGYYFVTTIKPEFKKNVSWKKRITQIQMIQFCIHLIFFTRISLNKSCEYSQFWSWFGFSQNLIFLILFTNFYVRNYLYVKKNVEKKL